MILQSSNGIPVRVSARYVPLTSTLKETLNNMAGTDLYKVRKETHGEISWAPETPKVAEPVKLFKLPLRHDSLQTMQKSCREKMGNDDYWECRQVDSHGRRGRNNKYKDRRRMTVGF